MDSFLSSAQQLVADILQAFLVERDAAKTTAYFISPVSWIATNGGEGCHGIYQGEDAVGGFIRRHIRSHPDAFALCDRIFWARRLGADSCCILAALQVADAGKEGRALAVQLRVSCTVVLDAGRTARAAQLHMSAPNGETPPGEAPLQAVGARNFWLLQQSLYEKGVIGRSCSDASELIRRYEQIATEKEWYRIVSDLIEGVTFEYDRNSDAIQFYGRYEKYFKGPLRFENAKRYLKEAPFIFEQDYAQYRHLCRSFIRGETSVNAEMRLKTRDGAWTWFAVALRSLCDGRGRGARVIGKLVDIQRRKQLQQEAESRSQLDPMTNLYDKVSARSKMIEYLVNRSADTATALLVVDIDNFKKINDTLGHFTGDQVICFVADRIKKIFRASDIISRFGGDEFIILMKDIQNETAAAEKAARLIRVVAQECRPGVWRHPVTLSVGVAVAREMTTYWNLFQRADKALYAAKGKGKNRFEIYRPLLEGRRHVPAAQADDEAIPVHVAGQSYPAFVNSMLDLSLACDPAKSVAGVLQLLGKAFEADQALAVVFAAGRARVAGWWSAAGRTEPPDWLDAEKEAILPFFDGDGMLVCSDTNLLAEPLRETSRRRGCGALLQCLLVRAGAVIGLIGFGCRDKRVWAPRESALVQTAAKILTNAAGELRRDAAPPEGMA